jgi:diguanylate cyclase (GGDEF)-like protein/PAS domain S-box-containing protein
MNAPLPHSILASLMANAEPTSAAPTAAEGLPPALWQHVFEQADSPLLVLDAGHCVVHANADACRLLEMPAERLHERPRLCSIGQYVDTHGQPLPPAQFPGQRTLLTGRSQSDQVFKLITPKGTQRWLRCSASSLSAGEEPARVLLTLNDVTERVEADLARSQQWQQMLEIVKGSRLGLWHSLPWEQKLFLDAQAASLMGVEPELSPQAQMSAWAQALHPEDRDRVWQTVSRHLNGQLTSSVTECRVQAETGVWRWLRTRAHSLNDPATGRVLRLAGTVEDVSELKTVENAVNYSRNLLEALFEQAPMGIQLLDLSSGHTVMCNQALAEITGYSIEHLKSVSPDARSTSETAARRARWRRELLALGRTGPHEFTLRHADGSWRDARASAVRVYDPQGRPFAWAFIQDITNAKAHEAQLKTAATRDRLTGLPNRAAMLSHMQELLSQCASGASGGFATLFLDFDRFKLVNDTLGHAVGDSLLCEIADRLRSVVRDEPGWLCARFGGDEFVLTVPDIPRPAALLPFAQQLLEALKPAFYVGGHELHSSASVGVALAGQRRVDTETLLREADIAMYEAKRRGRAQLAFFGADMDARLQRSVLIENGLRHAVVRGELSVAYQPIVDLHDRHMVSAEALLRWRHPELGQVSPAEFIPVAEESGHILAIGEWVLRESCRQWMAWHAEQPSTRPHTVSVNLSRVQLAQGQRLISLVRSVLQDTGMAPEHLQLEVTEREVMSTQDDMVELLRQLHALGVKLAMDDFGTGASSLGCLRNLPFDVIKIDKSFMADLSRDIQAMAIAQATISVIGNLGMSSVAEGVENPEDVSVLQALGCQYGQGYLFQRPVAGSQLLSAWR